MLTVHLVTSLCEICRGNIKANRSPYRYFATAVVEVIHIYICKEISFKYVNMPVFFYL